MESHLQEYEIVTHTQLQTPLRAADGQPQAVHARGTMCFRSSAPGSKELGIETWVSTMVV